MSNTRHPNPSSVQQRVEEIFSYCKISGKINALKALFKPIGLSQIGCPPGGERLYHRAASRLPLRANVRRNILGAMDGNHYTMIKPRKITILLALLASLSLVVGMLLFFWTTDSANPILDPTNEWSYLIFIPLVIFLIHLWAVFESTSLKQVKAELKESERQHPDLRSRRMLLQTIPFLGTAMAVTIQKSFNFETVRALSWPAIIILLLTFGLYAKLMTDLSKRYVFSKQAIKEIESDERKNYEYFSWVVNARLIITIIVFAIIFASFYLVPFF